MIFFLNIITWEISPQMLTMKTITNLVKNKGVLEYNFFINKMQSCLNTSSF